MSWVQTGACPTCGAPIYTPMFWHGIYPPMPRYVCKHAPNSSTSIVSTNPLPRYPDAPTEAELRALDHPDECCWASDNHCCGNDHMTRSEAEAIQMQEQTSEYRRITE